jgi:basic amino acid/polyamine antiporter, APA family
VRAEPAAPLPRHLGLGSAAALVVASMIGSGVFTTSGFALAALGSRAAVLAAWAVGGVLAGCGALCYGALARRIPRSGGEYVLLRETLHPAAGFVAGWISLLAGFTAPIAAAALGLEAYVAGVLGARLPPRLLASAAVLVAGALHGVRSERGAALQTAAVALKLALIAGFLGLGAWLLPLRGAPGPPGPATGGAGAFALAVTFVSFSYSGWNAAVYVAGEVRDPQRTLPRSLLLGTVVVTAAYLGLNAVFLFSAPASALAGRADVAAVAAEALGGAPLRRAMAGLVALALFTSISSAVMAGPRVAAAMAADGLLPRRLAVVSRAPRAAVAAQVTLALAALWSSGLARLLGYVGFTLGLSAAATVVGLVVLRRREGPERVPVPGWPVVPAVFLAGTAAVSVLAAAREPTLALAGLGTAAAALPLYALLGRARPGSRPGSVPAARR